MKMESNLHWYASAKHGIHILSKIPQSTCSSHIYRHLYLYHLSVTLSMRENLVSQHSLFVLDYKQDLELG